MATATKAKVVATEKVAKKLGRPPVFKPAERRKVSVYLRRFGLSKGVVEAAKGSLHEGRGVKMSVITAAKVAAEFGIVFAKGRPCNK